MKASIHFDSQLLTAHEKEARLDWLFREAWLMPTLCPEKTFTPDASQGVKHVRLPQPKERISPRKTRGCEPVVCAHLFRRLNYGMELLTRPRCHHSAKARQGPVRASRTKQ